MTQQGPNVRLSLSTRDEVNKLAEAVWEQTKVRPTQNEIIANAIYFARLKYEAFSDYFRYSGVKFRKGDVVLLKLNSQRAGVVDTFMYGDIEMARVSVGRGPQELELTFPVSQIEHDSIVASDRIEDQAAA